MRKIIFLDIDGVLNPKWWVSRKPSDKYGCLFDPNTIVHLEEIIVNTGAVIVISSSWKDMGLSELQKMWKDRNLPGKVIDITPNYMSDEMLLNADVNDIDLDSLDIRGCEIKGWLTLHGSDVNNYVIIDDMDDILAEQESCFIQIDPEVGITKQDAMKSIAILNG
jgi:hypothetical protein